MSIAINTSLGQEALAGAGTQLQINQSNEFASQLQQASDNLKKSDTKQAKDDAKLRTACRDMEAVFLNLMLTRMRAAIPKSGLLGDTNQQNVIQSMLDTELTKNLAKAGGIGVADMLYKQLSTTNGVSQKKS